MTRKPGREVALSRTISTEAIPHYPRKRRLTMTVTGRILPVVPVDIH